MKLYNTLTKKIDDFEPREAGKVNFFVCGPTVYDLSHIGHAKTYIQMDLLARVLRANKYEVFYLQNITDIDDKIIARAAEQNISWDELARNYEKEYSADMKSLGIDSVNQYARATEFIEQIIKQVQSLINKKQAYVIENDGIYFEIATFIDYGKLSGRSEVKENDAESRIDQSDKKRGWNDFCVWKFSKQGEPSWAAPFGDGRPGWHIEDTAITEHYFGPQYDIHGGAEDLIFPHHEAELTIMESLSGKQPFVKYWAHAAFLNIDGSRMGKSIGNFITIRNIIEKGYDPMAIRLLMLQGHYRSPINFSWEILDAASNRLQSLKNLANLRFQTKIDGVDVSKLLKVIVNEINEALANDINSPKALASLSKLESELNDNLVNSSCQKKYNEFILTLDNLFGLQLANSKDITGDQKKLIEERENARKRKDWAKSDEIRDKLAAQNIEVKDTSKGPVWQRV